MAVQYCRGGASPSASGSGKPHVLHTVGAPRSPTPAAPSAGCVTCPWGQVAAANANEKGQIALGRWNSRYRQPAGGLCAGKRFARTCTHEDGAMTVAAQFLPNLIIIGARKSGTTSLHGYLNQHPDVFMSKPPELHFFDD